MKKKNRSSSLKAGIELIDGWVLISRDDNHQARGKTVWYIAWLELFRSKADALRFAADNQWSPPFKAVPANLCAIPK